MMRDGMWFIRVIYKDNREDTGFTLKNINLSTSFLGTFESFR